VTNPAELLEANPSLAPGGLRANRSLEELYDAGYNANEIAATLARPIEEILSAISLYQVERGSGM
jgi:hypothetical protein